MKPMILLLIVMFALTACAPTAQPTEDVTETLPPDTAVTSPPEGTNSPDNLNPFAPMPGDANLTRGNVFIQEASLVIRESYPPQIALTLKGELPTPCNQLRIQIGTPDSDNKISIDVYSVVNAEMACIQVIKPFEENVGLGTFPSGHYSVYVNEELVGEFDS